MLTTCRILLPAAVVGCLVVTSGGCGRSSSASVSIDENQMLAMRKPTAADQIACGNPALFNPLADPPTIQIKDREMGAMISRLSNISPVGIGRMSPKDFTNAGWVLAPFFIPV